MRVGNLLDESRKKIIKWFSNIIIITFLFRPFMFFAVALANLVLPSHVAHVAQLLLLSFSVLIQPLISFFFLETLFQRGVFAVVAIVWKVFDWYSILDLLKRAHVLFTTHNVYYWILNYFHFGLLGSWPILRFVCSSYFLYFHTYISPYKKD